MATKEIASLIKKRAALKSKLKIFKNHLVLQQSCVTLSKVQLDELQNRLNKIEGIYEEFDVLQAELDDLLDDSAADDQFNERNGFDNEYFSIITAAQNVIQSHRSQFQNQDNMSGGKTWRTFKGQLKQGSLVVIKDKTLPSLMWLLGRVIRIITGNDGVSRTADIRIKKGALRRQQQQPYPSKALKSLALQGGQSGRGRRHGNRRGNKPLRAARGRGRMSGGGAGLMSCVREGSLEPPYRPPHTQTHNNGERRGGFLRGLRRMFKRRGSGARVDASPDPKSSSTSELLDAERHARRKEGAYGSGLSVSHDSVFTGERSGDESSDERPTPAHHLAHLATSHRAELVAAVRRRGRGDGSDDDEDLGLPRSPPASPPTDKADKRHHAGISQSSCSDGSLLSVGSSEMDEDSSSGHHHSHDHSNRSDHSDIYNTSEPPTGVAPLSHSAARHKMAVRPRRTHGAPRRKKNNPIAALPITPELNEEVIRSTTPEVKHKTSEVVTESFSSSTTTKHMIVKDQHLLVNRELQRVMETPSDTKLKSSSLPPGLALSQLVGQSPAKLSLADQETPRSSIKRSKSSSQGQSLRDSSPKPQVTEHQINTYHSEERMTKYRTDKKAEESCLEKKSKSEKKIENEVIRKKEESFFSRLLLRKSGKKSKKETNDTDGQQDVKKSKTEKSTAQYKVVDSERSGYYGEGQGYKPVPAERTHKSAGQKAFANQMHKRLDNKGSYVQDSAYKDVYSAAKVAGVEYNITDLKVAEETDKMLNLEMKSRFSRRDEFSEKVDRAKRTSSKEAIDVMKDNINFHEKSKRPTSMQRDSFPSKTFINNEIASRVREDALLPAIALLDDDVPTRAMKIKSTHDYTFHSGSMPKNIPYFNPNMGMSSSCSPPKTIKHPSSENIKHRSSEHVSEFVDKTDSKHGSIKRSSKTEEAFVRSEMRSLGDEYVETRSSIGKSHSFRYASETTSISSQENQMPSLPAIVGISEPLLQSWEVNYRRNVTERHDYSHQRISARNYNILHTNAEANYDSLPSTDSSYLDSLKTDVNEDRKLFTNSIHITMDSHKRDSDISQIEAKIDDIISSPKPIIAPILKSSSLDSVKSSPEKPMEDRRKTISVESALSQSPKVNTQKEKLDVEGFISVTHISNDQTQTPTKNNENAKINKSDEKIQKSGTKPGVPEFLNIQLNKVDTKPTTNIVLTANVTPKKLDSPQADKELDVECFQITETKLTQTLPKKDSVNKIVENVAEVQPEEKASPAVSRKSVQSAIQPQSPSTPKAFFKRKAASVELQERSEKPRTNSMSTDGSTERIYDNISMDQKSHSSFGSKSSIQSIDSNDVKAPDRHEEAVVYRRKPVMLPKDIRNSSDRKNDDEPELMKVFARRSLKLKDSEADSLAHDIAEANNAKDEINENLTATRTKIHKNEFNASIKSRDSDKENEDASLREQAEEKRLVDIAARVSQFGAPHYQRSVSINSVSNPKRESAPVYRSEVNKYKKEVSDSTPEKRLRNRTFPDPSNDRDDIKNITKSEAMAYKADTLTKRPWQRKDDDKLRRLSVEKEKRESAVIEKDGDTEKDEGGREKDGAGGEADASPQFKGILQMRAEWERRAKQGMTK